MTQFYEAYDELFHNDVGIREPFRNAPQDFEVWL